MGNTNPVRKYVPLYKAEYASGVDTSRRTVTVASSLVPLLDLCENPAEGYSLAEAITLVLVGVADAVGDAQGRVLYDRARCERLADLACLLEGKNLLPVELLNLKQWVIWRGVWDDSKKKWKKPPLSPLTGESLRGEHGSAERQAHYVTFAEAVAAALKHDADGIGFSFTEDDPYVGIDFDDCITEGAIHPEVENWRKNFFSVTYAEISPSGTGIHIIGRGALAHALAATPLPKATGVTVEAYNRGRFFCVTGRRVGESSVIADVQVRVDKLLSDLGNQPAASGTPPKKTEQQERLYHRSEVRRMYATALEKLKTNREGSKSGNGTLYDAAVVAARTFSSDVFRKTEDDFKKELFHIVTEDWSSPHPAQGARATIDSGWRDGVALGPYKLSSPTIEAVTAADYCAQAPEKREFIIEGLIAEGTTTQLIAPIKEGKTTFLMAMLNCMEGGQDFIGKKTKPVRVLYVTEQPLASFQDQLIRAGLKDSISLHVLEMGKLFRLDWDGRAEVIHENVVKFGIELVIIDTFARLAMIEDIKDASKVNAAIDAVTPIVTEENKSLILVWHARKAGGTLQEMAVGTVASGAAADMLIGLRRPSTARPGERERIIETLGRFPGAFDESGAIRLNEDMTNYTFEGTPQEASARTTEQHILSMLPARSPGLTFGEIYDRYRTQMETRGVEPQSEKTMERALNKLVENGLASREGKGGKADPFRFVSREPSASGRNGQQNISF